MGSPPGSARPSSRCSTACTSPTAATGSTSRPLRRGGVSDRDVLAAGLLHDGGKGDTGRAADRVLARAGVRAWVSAPARLVPGWAPRSVGCGTTPRRRRLAEPAGLHAARPWS